MRILAALFITLFVALAHAQDDNQPFVVGELEFFGYSKLDLEPIKAVIPLHTGDAITIKDSPGVRERIIQAVKHSLGREATDVEFVCCDERGKLMVFVGLPGESNRKFQYNSRPRGSSRLPQHVLDLYQRAMELNFEAVQKQPGEDRSKGYALSDYAPMRATQLAIRDFAVHHEPLIRHVLSTAAGSDQRKAAAYALGYARHSKRQVMALVRASRDPHDGVRNDALRALGVLASLERVSAWIPAQGFARMLNSGVWKDRNKAGLLLYSLSERRDAHLLRILRLQALDSLVEMARWRNPGHAHDARVILGRIAGIEEKRLQEMAATGMEEEIIRAARTGK